MQFYKVFVFDTDKEKIIKYKFRNKKGISEEIILDCLQLSAYIYCPRDRILGKEYLSEPVPIGCVLNNLAKKGKTIEDIYPYSDYQLSYFGVCKNRNDSFYFQRFRKNMKIFHPIKIERAIDEIIGEITDMDEDNYDKDAGS